MSEKVKHKKSHGHSHDHAHGHSHDHHDEHEHVDEHFQDNNYFSSFPPSPNQGLVNVDINIDNFNQINTNQGLGDITGMTERKLPTFIPKSNSGVYSSNNSFPSNDFYDLNKNESDKKYSSKGWIRSLWNDEDCRHLFLFTILLLILSFISIGYGAWASSLGLLSSGFHTIFDAFSMIISLAAMIIAKQAPTKNFSFGYDRLEVLSGFSNGVFLIFVSLFLVKEVIEHALEEESSETNSHEVHTQGIIAVSLIGLVINIIGVLFFREHGGNRSEIRHAHEENVQSIFVHILTDIIGNIGVIVSAVLVGMGWELADPAVALFIAFMMAYNAWPICNRTAKVLLQTTPLSIKDSLDKCLHEASTLEGVLECKDTHFWTQAPGVFVGSIHFHVRADANEQMILSKATNIFRNYVTHLTIQVEKDE